MTDIGERRVVLCPEREASRRLVAFVAEHRAAGGSVSITLRLPIKMFAACKLPGERRGVASFYSFAPAGDPHPTNSVTWSSDAGRRTKDRDCRKARVVVSRRWREGRGLPNPNGMGDKLDSASSTILRYRRDAFDDRR
jgi:hypothetical protein